MTSNVILYIVFFAVGYTHTSCNNAKTLQRDYIGHAKEFMKYIRSTQFSNDTILLADKPDTREFNRCTNSIFYDTTLFTEAEQDLIKSQINKPLLKKWNERLVEKVKIISRDTLDVIFKERNKSWQYFYRHFGRRFHSFCAPIFLRNNTLCIFYAEYGCGSLCGAGQIQLYKKEGDVWKPVKSFCDWVS